MRIPAVAFLQSVMSLLILPTPAPSYHREISSGNIGDEIIVPIIKSDLKTHNYQIKNKEKSEFEESANSFTPKPLYDIKHSKYLNLSVREGVGQNSSIPASKDCATASSAH